MVMIPTGNSTVRTFVFGYDPNREKHCEDIRVWL